MNDVAAKAIATKAKRAEKYQRDNEMAARLIAAEPDKYNGILAEWSARTLAIAAGKE